MSESYKNIWPGWETVGKIGTGGFGSVYEIQRDVFGKTEKAALKVISIPQNDEEITELYNEGYEEGSVSAHYKSYLESIVKEYSIMLDMKGHPNIVYCDDLRYVQHEDGIGWDIFIKMELLTPLTRVSAKDFNEAQIVKLGKDIANALVACKKQNIVHRDIKPQNIFVSKNGDYKLGDFGIAKVSEKTQSGTKIGTFEYMPPEVYSGKAYGAAADIYSLGLVLYWLLNGKKSPFLSQVKEIPTPEEKMEARLRRLEGESLPEPINGSKELKRIVLKACAFKPEDRYSSAAEMFDDLDSVAVVAKSTEKAAVAAVADEDEPTASLFDDDATSAILASYAARTQATEKLNDDEQTEALGFTQDLDKTEALNDSRPVVAAPSDMANVINNTDFGEFNGEEDTYVLPDNRAQDQSENGEKSTENGEKSTENGEKSTESDDGGKIVKAAILTCMLIILAIIAFSCMSKCDSDDYFGASFDSYRPNTSTVSNKPSVDKYYTHTHSYSSWWQSNETNHWKVCDCGEKTELSDHSWNDWTTITAATENSTGSRERSCSVCQFTEIATIPELSHTHSYSSLWRTNETSHWKVCDCGEKADMASHSWTDWTTITAATENSTGSRERSCSACQFTETATIPVLSHTHSYSSSWQSNETNHWKICSCGEKGNMANHSWGSWKTIKTATETSTGSRERSCSVCKFKETATIPVLSHTHSYSLSWQTNETSHWKVCSCGEKANMANHNYGSWTTVTNATHTSVGLKVRNCKYCGHEDAAPIPSVSEHVYTSWEQKNAPVCIITGSDERHCIYCDKVQIRASDLSDHSFLNGTCIGCGAEEMDYSNWDPCFSVVVSASQSDNLRPGDIFTVNVKVVNVTLNDIGQYGMKLLFNNDVLEIINERSGNAAMDALDYVENWNDLSSFHDTDYGVAVSLCAYDRDVYSSYNPSPDAINTTVSFTLTFRVKENVYGDTTMWVLNEDVKGCVFDSDTFLDTEYPGMGSGCRIYFAEE